MYEVRTATFVLYEDPHNGERVQTVAVGDEGQGETLVAGVEARGNAVLEIQVCDVSDVSPKSAWWETGILGVRPETIRALGSVVGEPKEA